MTFAERILNYSKAAYPILVINTHEEKRVTNDLYDALKERDGFGKFYFWDCVSGIQARDDDNFKTPKDSQDALKLLTWIEDAPKRGEKKSVYVLRDFHTELESRTRAKEYIRTLRNLSNFLRRDANMIVFVSPQFIIPTELERDIQIVEFALPDDQAVKNTLQDNLKGTNKALEAKGKPPVTLTDDFVENVVEAAKGMTAAEVDAAFALASITTKGVFNKSYVEVVFEEKIAQIKKNTLLEYIPVDISFDEVGALENVKEWVLKRRKVFSPEARAYGLKLPKSVLLSGVPGTGKTLISKAIANAFSSPLWKLDVGKLFSSRVGNLQLTF